MKILRKGKHPDETTHQGTCNRCRTEVEFLRSEGEVVHDQREGSFVKVACPVCGSPIYSDLRQGVTHDR